MAAPAGGAGFSVAGATGGGSAIPTPMFPMMPLRDVRNAVAAGKAAGGSTGARKIMLKGVPYIYKSGPAPQIVNEFAAFMLYKVAGARVPDATLVYDTAVPVEGLPGIPRGILLQYIEGETAGDLLRKKTLSTGSEILMRNFLCDEFLYHALFANWDAKNSLNHIIPTGADGKPDVYKPYAIDLGGALFYRAMGEKKPAAEFLATELPELYDIPTESAKTASKIYKNMRKESVLRGVLCGKLKQKNEGVPVIQHDRIHAMATALVPLLAPYIRRSVELPDIVLGRLELLQSFCRTGTLINNIPYYAKEIERGATYEVPSNNRKAYLLGRKHRNTLKSGYERDISRFIMMRGKRALTPYSPLEPANLSGVGLSATGAALAATLATDPNADEPLLPDPAIATEGRGGVRDSLLAMRKDPAIMGWLQRQVDFVNGLNKRERSLLNAYTQFGDRLVNNYSRGTLRADIGLLLMNMILGRGVVNDGDEPSKELLMQYWAADAAKHESNDDPIALAFGIVDQINTLVRNPALTLVYPEGGGGGYVRREDLLDKAGDINMPLIRRLLRDNFDYFRVAEHVLPFVEQFKRELTAVIARAPRAPVAFTVFRGIHRETHLSELTFQNVDFLSTSIVPESVVEYFTDKIESKLGPTYHCCVYELTVRPDVPCIYLEPVTECSGEYEILLPPDLVVSLEATVQMKLFVPLDKAVGEPANLLTLQKNMDRHTVSVIEGTVRLPSVEAVGPRPVFERGSLEELGRPVRGWTESRERFVEAKPKCMRRGKGRNRTRRNWNRNKRTETRRRSGSNGL
jgi:hypothetical protein